MATLSGHQTVIGYGPAASAAHSYSIPEFSGDSRLFADFDFKLKAVAFEHSLDEILLKPQVWLASMESLKQRVERSGASTRSSSASADHAQEQAQLHAEQGKYKFLARILIEIKAQCHATPS